MADVGYYTLPVIVSFQGIDSAVNKELGDVKPAAKKAGQDYADSMADGVRVGGKKIDDELSKNLIRARCEGRYATSVFQPLGVVESDLTA